VEKYVALAIVIVLTLLVAWLLARQGPPPDEDV
jgi:hypothetical protein